MTGEFPAMTKYWMALSSVRGVGPKTLRALVSRFGTPERVFSASIVEIAQMPRLNLRLAHEIAGVERRLAGFEKFIARMAETGTDVLCPDSWEYPRLLKLTEDFPPILYKRGSGLPKDKPTVAIVGSRTPTPSGAKAAEGMAESLAGRGIVIVSGLAQGIDTSAHRGALKVGGKTCAVLGSGLRMVYPRQNRQLADDICVNGAVFSECHPNEVVSRQRLIQRNRIISGLSLGVILIEPKSGALNTAERALRQNRYVFIHDPGSSIVLAPWLSESAFAIHGIDELDAVVDRLLKVENRGGEMHLL